MPTKPPAGRSRPTFTDQEALQFHSAGRPGKLEVIASKPMATQRDLSLAYSPGVAVPVLAIAEDASRAYDYTVKGNGDSGKYHEPDGQWYDQTIAEFWFKSAQDAEAAGFTKAGA